MTERTSYAPGTPSWIDVSSPDIPGSVAFYRALFGWTDVDTGPEGGGYRMLMIDDKAVAGIGPLQQGHPSWTTYVTVVDADATAATITAAGGMVIVPPFDVLEAGRMAIAFDPIGAAFSLWQPYGHIGSQLVSEANTFCWSELNVRGDLAVPTEFYRSVFGWEPKTAPDGSYTELELDGSSIAGMMAMPPGVPDEVPSHWLTYFAVDDCDSTVARVLELGGALLAPAMDMGPGRLAVFADPVGATFAVMQFIQVAA